MGADALQSSRITRLLSDLSPARLEEFWGSLDGPLIEPDGDSYLVTFLWRGSASSTRAWWGVDVPLCRVAGTDLWYGTQRMPADLCTTYVLAHEGAAHAPRDATGVGATHVDPFNPHRLHFPADPDDPDDYDSWVSVLSLPAAASEPWTAPRRGVPSGSLTASVLPGAALGGPRDVVVYRPFGVPAAGLPVLVVFDGFLARHVLRLPTVLDNLIAAGSIPPVVALFVSSREKSREQDLSPTRPIHVFVEHELMPWALEHVGAGDPRRNVIAGVSRGGLAAAYVGLCAHSLFGGVVAQSGSFWWPSPGEGKPGWLARQVTRYPKVDVRFYLDVGVRETMPGPGGAPSQVSVVREMRETLVGHGYSVAYTEYQGGHDYVNWRRTFPEGLVSVLG